MRKLDIDVILRGKEYSKRRRITKQVGRLKCRVKQMEEELAWTQRENELLKQQLKIPF